MSALEMPDRHYLSAAIGWLELGNCGEACEELNRIAPESQENPAVLTVRYGIHARTKNWELATATAVALTHRQPDEPQSWIWLAYATRRQTKDGIHAAKKILENAIARFPEESLIAYNLACYEAQLGQLPAAREWLVIARKHAGTAQILSLALNDPDLKPLWDEIHLW